MRIHHLNCVTMCPPGGALMDGRQHAKGLSASLVCHCLLIETERGLVLVDTGFGLGDVREPRPRLSGFFLGLNRPQLHEEMTAIRQVERLGFKADDVRHIVLTHLDLDHAGGLADFPRARVHVLATEHAAAQARRTLMERQRYQAVQWAHGPDWRLYDTARGEPWFGFDCVRALDGLPPEVLLVPLTGHTRGHCGVAVDTGQGWLLHAGDAYFFRDELAPEPHCPPGLRLLQNILAMENASRRENRRRLRELSCTHGAQVRVFCAHDAEQWRQLAATSS